MLLVGLALAGPSRCVASWTARDATCALRGELSASGAGLTQKGAERAAERQLARVLEISVGVQRASTPVLEEGDFTGCAADARANAYMNCFSEPELGREDLCFIELTDPACWDGTVLQIEGVGWEMLTAGRTKMCAEVDARLVRLNYTGLDARRAACAASCESKTLVRCPK